LFVKSEKLTETEKKHDPLTIVFKSDMEVAEWFLSWDMVFRKYTSKALTGCMEIQVCTRDIWKATSYELLTKQALKKNFYYIQKIHTYLSYFSA
jgi:hypothetical protein